MLLNEYRDQVVRFSVAILVLQGWCLLNTFSNFILLQVSQTKPRVRKLTKAESYNVIHSQDLDKKGFDTMSNRMEDITDSGIPEPCAQSAREITTTKGMRGPESGILGSFHLYLHRHHWSRRSLPRCTKALISLFPYHLEMSKRHDSRIHALV